MFEEKIKKLEEELKESVSKEELKEARTKVGILEKEFTVKLQQATIGMEQVKGMKEMLFALENHAFRITSIKKDNVKKEKLK